MWEGAQVYIGKGEEFRKIHCHITVTCNEMERNSEVTFIMTPHIWLELGGWSTRSNILNIRTVLEEFIATVRK